VQGAATEPKPELAPAATPLFSITSDKTLWRSVDLGRLTLETERINNGMALKQLELTGKEQQLKLSGDLGKSTDCIPKPACKVVWKRPERASGWPNWILPKN